MAYMDKHQQRANFAPLLHSFGLHGHCIEVGVAAGRYSELLLLHAQPRRLTLVEPFPNKALAARLSSYGNTSWSARGVGVLVRKGSIPRHSRRFVRLHCNLTRFMLLLSKHSHEPQPVHLLQTQRLRRASPIVTHAGLYQELIRSTSKIRYR